jgi:peptide/nickel transport system ATP-binding protein
MQATPRAGATLRQLMPDDAPPSAPSANDAGPGSGAVRGEPLLVVQNLLKEYPRKYASGRFSRLIARKAAADLPFRAVNNLAFTIHRGETVGLVGESGCGKSTTSMMLMRLLDPTAGSISFAGEDIASVPARDFARHPLRSKIQMVFQDPTDSLNPRYTASRAIADPILRFGPQQGRAAVRRRCEELATLVGLPLDLLDRFPHQLSGGQKARVGIARAIALDPELVILDEPTAALDVSVQAIVLNLLADLRARLGMSYLFVSHDLSVVRMLCERVIVMKSGEIVEQGCAAQVIDHPQHPYTRELIAAIPHAPSGVAA